MEKSQDLFNFISAGEYPSGFTKSQKQRLKKYASKCTIKGDEVYFEGKMLVKSREEARRIFGEFHSTPMGGHSGIVKTRKAMSSRFIWKGMSKDIERWIQECHQCQKIGKPLVAPKALECIKVSAVWELVGIDLTGPLPKTADGYQYILTATDYYSKWVEAYPLKSKSAVEVGQRLCSMIYRHGCPQRILSDQGREFVNQLNDRMCCLLGIKRSVTAAYHPQTNGLDEKTNDNIKRALRKLVNDQQSNWDVYLEATLFSLRSKSQCTTKHSPFFLMYGREAVFPSEVPVDLPLSNIIMPTEGSYDTFVAEKKASMDKVKEAVMQNIQKAQDKQKLAHEKKVLKKNKGLCYKLGDEVLLYNARKRGRKGGRMELDFSGPYIIREMCGKVVGLSTLQGVALNRNTSIDHLKPYRRAVGMSSEENLCSALSNNDIPIELSPEPCLNVVQTIEDRVKMLWAAEDDDSVQAVVGPYKLHVSSFHRLRGIGWLSDEVIDAYLHHLIAKHQEPVHQLSAVIATSLFTGELEKVGKLPFSSKDVWICPVNLQKHWILVIVIVSEQVLVVIDPMGNEISYYSILQNNWGLFLNMKSREAQWKTWIMEHNNQQDSHSCGVLILLFAKEFLRTRTINIVKTTSKAMMDARLDIACALLQYTDQ